MSIEKIYIFFLKVSAEAEAWLWTIGEVHAHGIANLVSQQKGELLAG